MTMEIFKKLLPMYLLVLVAAIGYYFYKVNKDKLKRSGKWEITQKRKLHNRYVIYNNNVFTRKRFRRIVTQFSSMACYDFDVVKERSVRLFEKAVGIAVLMPALALIAFRNVLLTALVSLVGYIYYDITVDKEIDRVYTQIIEEITLCIASIRERYIETDNVPKAVLLCKKGKMLEQPLMQIYEMLVAVDSEARLKEFCRASPVRLLKTLAMICYIVNENGDVGKDATATFPDELTILRQEADAERFRLLETRLAFKSLQVLAMVGLILTPVADWFLTTYIPGTISIVKGMYGQIEKTAIILITIAAYYLISMMTKPSVVNQTDKVEWIDNLCRQKKVKDRLQDLIPKKLKTRMRWKHAIDSSLSSKTMEYIYLSKVIYSAIITAATIFILLGFVVTAKSVIWSNYQSFGTVDSADSGMTEKMYNLLVEIDKEYMNTKPRMERVETEAFVKSRLTGANDLIVSQQVDRLMAKYEKYYGIGFKWYYILIAFFCGVGGWFVPELSLKLRRFLVKFEESEDVMQLQTLMVVISNTSMDAHRALYWLEKQSTIHKAVFRFAYHDFTMNPEQALDNLERSVKSSDLKRLVSKLSAAVYRLTLQDAFSDMMLEKDYSLRERTALQKAALESKKEWASLIASAPIGCLLICGFMLPIGILGYTQLMNSFAALT